MQAAMAPNERLAPGLPHLPGVDARNLMIQSASHLPSTWMVSSHGFCSSINLSDYQGAAVDVIFALNPKDLA